MKKRILALITALSLICVPTYVYGAENSGVAAVDGNVAISCTTQAQAGTPVGIFILPAIIVGDEDKTAEKVGEVGSQEGLNALGVEYATYVKAAEDGTVTHNCTMKDSLTTGTCHVVFTFLGSQAYIAGSFEHVGKNDVNAIVTKFNNAAAGEYSGIIDEDVNGEFEADGETRKAPKEILRKSSADISYYNSLSDKTQFCEVLYSFKPTEGFALPSLIAKFNETAAWIRLRNEADTLSVLNTYNGTGEGKYWNIEIDSNSDFASLSDTEKTNILDTIKNAKYTKTADLEKGFTDNLVLALFRMQTTRTPLENLIKADGKYASYFAGARTIIENANLDTYNLALLYNNVLANNANAACTTIGEIESLFRNSIPQSTTPDGGDSDESGVSLGSGGGGGGGGGFKNSTSKAEEEATLPQTSATPFADVEKTHWANEYIARLYESGAINGVSESAFNPSGTVLRQDFVKILVGALGTRLSESKSKFSDVANGAYYESYVMTAFEKGFISGIGDGTFGVGSNLKREDAAVIMARVLESYGVKTLQPEKTFNDDAQISLYAKDSVKKVSAAQIFGGDNLGNFNPKGNLTRAEACAILCRLADAVKEV